MAEEINFIRPQEVYDRNTGESKVRYRSYDGNDRFIPVVDGEKGVPKTMVEVTHAELKAMRDGGKLTAGALYRITDYNCTTTQENTQSAGHQFDIVLLALSNNKLAEEGWAMMHDNIYDVTFKDGITKKCYLYNPIPEQEDTWNIVDVETLLGLIGADITTDLLINEETKTATERSYNSIELTTENCPYNYFQNSNLSAWKVWYCLDNDTARFAWADDSVDDKAKISWIEIDESFISTRDTEADTTLNGTNYFAWYDEHYGKDLYTTNEIPSVGDKIYEIAQNMGGQSVASEFSTVDSYSNATNLPNGRGVIYRLIDEFNNDIKYDFKNIQFKRKLTDGQYDATNGTETWCYTLNLWHEDMCQDASIVGNTLPNDEGYVTGVYDNVFGYVTAYYYYIEGVNTFAFALGNNVVLSTLEGDYYGIYSNTIGNSFTNNTIGSAFTNNVIGSNFNSNTIGNYFGENIIGTSFSANTIGHDFYSNTIGNNFMDNTIGNGVNYNMIGNRFSNKTISNKTSGKNYGNNGVELATKS